MRRYFWLFVALFLTSCGRPPATPAVNVDATQTRLAELTYIATLTAPTPTAPPVSATQTSIDLTDMSQSPAATSTTRTIRPPSSTPAPASNRSIVKKTVVKKLGLRTNELLYDPIRERIYASVPGTAGRGGNSIVSIDPIERTVSSPIFVGSEPNQLALSENGEYLYVGFDGTAVVRRVDMKTQMAGPQFALGSEQHHGPYFVGDIAVLPRNPNAVAVSRIYKGISPMHAGVALYVGGKKRPNETEAHTGANVIQFCGSASTLYGYNNESSAFGFYTMAVDANGVTVRDVTQGLVSGFGTEIKCDDGLIYAASGQVVHPKSRTLVGSFPDLLPGALVEPDSKIGRTFFLTRGEREQYAIVIFDQRTFTLIGSFDVPGVSGTPGSLIRWGTDGLAFRTDEGQVYLLRSPFVAGQS